MDQSPSFKKVCNFSDNYSSFVFYREGAGDCSSCVAVMLELARGVSQWAHGFKNAVIFLFNTGEEEGLNGAHSFITQVSVFWSSPSEGRVIKTPSVFVYFSVPSVFVYFSVN